MVSLHNSIIEPHVFDSDYTQHDCSHREIQVYISLVQTRQRSENPKRLDRQAGAVYHLQNGTTNRRQFPSPLDYTDVCRDFAKGVTCYRNVSDKETPASSRLS